MIYEFELSNLFCFCTKIASDLSLTELAETLLLWLTYELDFDN